MEKIKVLQFTIGNIKGGITQYVLQNWKFIDKEKFHFDFATMSKSLDFADKLEQQGCKIFYISCYAEEDEKRFDDELRNILKNGKYDVLHLHTRMWRSFKMEELAKEAGVKKIIVHSHNTGIDTVDPEKRNAEITLHKQVLEQLTEGVATDFWACSEAAADFLFADKISRNKVKIMPNAIELERYQYCEDIRKEVRNELGLEDKFVIGHVGRFAYQKNHEFLIDVFAEVCKEKDNAVLLLIGDGELKENISQKTETLGLNNRVIFAGKRDDVHRLLQGIDVFCLPSRFEGLPISAVEAQAADLPCLCSEAITREVKLMENVRFLTFDKSEWVKAILAFDNGYKRRDRRQDLREKGYDIITQIKTVEKEYS